MRFPPWQHLCGSVFYSKQSAKVRLKKVIFLPLVRKDHFSPISCLLADEPSLAFGPAMMGSTVWLHAVLGVSDFILPPVSL